MSLLSEPQSADAGEIQPQLDPMGWISLAAGFLVALITFFTSYSHVDVFGFLQFQVNQQIEIPLLLAALAPLLSRLNWHPTVDAQIRSLESERREQESKKRTKLIESEIERLEKENGRLAKLNSRLDALLLSADSSSPAPPATDSN